VLVLVLVLSRSVTPYSRRGDSVSRPRREPRVAGADPVGCDCGYAADIGN